ncbi:MAG: S-methyl-5-thioribose-1-phosphate isomerase [Bacillota bacterium]
MVQAVKWQDERLVLLDQRYLPERVDYVESGDFREIARAITDMVVRGAPAIGIAGAYGVAAAAREASEGAMASGQGLAFVPQFLHEAAAVLTSARPTAVNLKWAVDRVMAKTLEALSAAGGASFVDVAETEARAIEEEDIAMNRRMGEHGAALFKEGTRVLTHCNAGALATGGYGTALGVIRSAYAQGKVSMVYADETRPYLQGARLTAWELLQDGIPVTVLVDSAAGYLISTGGVDCIIVGADRIAKNGDVANKIGTYTLACLASIHRIPFYVAAPSSTFDLSIPDKSGIPVEMRPESEVLSFKGAGVAPTGAKAFNPAFDLTPSGLISAIITERGVIFPPIGENLPKIVLGDDLGA